jgi:cytoskeletal protein RodZ
MTETLHATATAAAEPFRPQPDGSIDPAGEAGWFLQRERQRRQLSLETVAQETGIHESHLDGIEVGDLTRLPSRREALKMVGIYGQYLGFDPEPLIIHYAEFLPRPIAPARAAAGPMPRPLSSATVISFSHALRRAPVRRMGRTIGSCLIVMILFSAVMWFLGPQMPGEEVTAAIDPLPTASVAPESESEPAPPPVEVSVTETPMGDDRPEEDPPAAPESQPASGQGSLTELIVRTMSEDDLEPVLTVSELLPESTEAIEPPTPGGRIVGAENTAARIVLTAKGPVLIRIEDGRGNVVDSHTLATGDRYQVPSRDDLVVVAGDGGLVGVEIDGVARGTLGTPGEIVVGRPLKVSTFLEGRG